MNLELNLAINEASAEEKGEFTHPRKKMEKKYCHPGISFNLISLHR